MTLLSQARFYALSFQQATQAPNGQKLVKMG